jgi:non-ribosomal peptide synthetase component F
MKPSYKKRSKRLRKTRRRRGGDPTADLKKAATDAIPDVNAGKDKLDEYLNTVIASKNSTGKPKPTEITHNNKTYVYSYRRDMSRTFYLDVHEKSNPTLTVTLYSFNDY